MSNKYWSDSCEHIEGLQLFLTYFFFSLGEIWFEQRQHRTLKQHKNYKIRDETYAYILCICWLFLHSSSHSRLKEGNCYVCTKVPWYCISSLSSAADILEIPIFGHDTLTCLLLFSGLVLEFLIHIIGLLVLVSI